MNRNLNQKGGGPRRVQARAAPYGWMPGKIEAFDQDKKNSQELSELEEGTWCFPRNVISEATQSRSSSSKFLSFPLLSIGNTGCLILHHARRGALGVTVAWR